MIFFCAGDMTVETAVRHIHRDLVKDVKFAVVWGKSSKHNPQRVGLGQTLIYLVRLVLRKSDNTF